MEQLFEQPLGLLDEIPNQVDFSGEFANQAITIFEGIPQILTG